MNQKYIEQQIQLKNQSGHPYISWGNDVKHVITDVDHFPYTRFYRGVYNDFKPHIWEREAGYHILNNQNYDFIPIYNIQYPQNTFQIPCSTILPSAYNKKTNLSTNNDCVNESP
jgi:hypothetical protein